MIRIHFQSLDTAPIWRLLLAGYWLTLIVATHWPPTFGPLPGQQSDKLAHLAVYASLAWLLAMAWQHSAGRLNGRHLRFAWLAVASFAAVDEFTQPFVNRVASENDWLADAAGAAAGLWIFWLWNRNGKLPSVNQR